MKRTDIFFWLLFAIFLTSFFVPAYMLPDGPVIGYRCSWVPLTGLKEGSLGPVLGTLANFVVWGVVFLRKVVKKKSVAIVLTVLTFLSTFSWLVIMEGFSTESLLVGYWLWAISSPILVYVGHLTTTQRRAS
jgi:hypothetical protein